MPTELLVPPSVASDQKALELVRAWAAHGGLHCSLNVDAWPADKAAIGWGILLSDLARHVADAFHQNQRWDKKETLEQIRAVFNSELSSPSADADGKFV
jgi:hypothetical protein